MPKGSTAENLSPSQEELDFNSKSTDGGEAIRPPANPADSEAPFQKKWDLLIYPKLQKTIFLLQKNNCQMSAYLDLLVHDEIVKHLNEGYQPYSDIKRLAEAIDELAEENINAETKNLLLSVKADLLSLLQK